MATRSIVTTQPDVACDVCERRLLRGEHPEVFLAAGQRRMVCELCAPRAAHEGWLREADGNSVSLPPLRARRGRNLFERLRQVGRPAGRSVERHAMSLSRDREPEPYDFLNGFARGAEGPSVELVEDRSGMGGAAAEPGGAPARTGAEVPGVPSTQPSGRSAPVLAGIVVEGDGLLERAIEVFNAGEYPRRVAGVARSLGVPAVSIRPSEDFAGVVAIVVAWELCWYRYEVDVGEEAADAQVLAQGTELGELTREDRRGNAVADELGALSLSGP